MNLSFKQFYKEYKWLFVIAIMMPVLWLSAYCLIYRDRYLDEGIWATITSSLVAYIGTIAWGIFIFYDSWLRKKEQEYKERPILSIQAKLSDKVPLDYQMYDKAEVEEILNRSVGIHGLRQVQEKSHSIKYVAVTITNFGLSLISDIALLDVYLDKDKESIHQGKYGYLSSLDIPKTLSYKDKWIAYVAIDETLFYKLSEGYKSISIYFKLKQNMLETYFVVITIHTCGRGTYSQDVKIYREKEYDELKQVTKNNLFNMSCNRLKKWLKKNLQIIWYCLLLCASSVYVGFNINQLLNDSILKEFRGEHIIFILWFVLLIFPLFDSFEGFGFKLAKEKLEQQTDSELRELSKNVLTKREVTALELEEDVNKITREEK